MVLENIVKVEEKGDFIKVVLIVFFFNFYGGGYVNYFFFWENFVFVSREGGGEFKGDFKVCWV